MASPERPKFRHPQKDQVPLDLSHFEQVSIASEAGSSNTNSVETIKDKRTSIVYVKRTLRRENGLAQLIHRLSEEEFPAVGFEGKVHGRSMKEQAEHMQKASELGLAVPLPFDADEQTLIYPYVQGETLSKQLKDGKTEAIAPTLASLADAHKQGVIYGDRYPGNIIVQEDGQIKHIDFDVALTGEKAKELELSQFLWAVSDQTTDIEAVAGTVGEFFRKHPKPQYDWDQVKTFIERYDMYLRRFTNDEPRLGNKLRTVTLAMT